MLPDSSIFFMTFMLLVAILVFLLATAVMAAALPNIIHTNEIELTISDEGKILLTESKELDIAFICNDACSAGMNLICINSSIGNNQIMTTNEAYYIERLSQSGWLQLSSVYDDHIMDYSFTDISKTGAYEWTLDWRNTFGDLPSGTYRLCKHVFTIDNRSISNSYEYRIEFIIE